MRPSDLHYIMEYLPIRYAATAEQENDRQVVYSFKNGNCSFSLMKRIAEEIKKIKETVDGKNWRVCFIPASTRHNTVLRYQRLATFIERETGVACNCQTVMPAIDQQPSHITGKKGDSTKNFCVNATDVKERDIILIDDVITRGYTFAQTARKLRKNGANKVVGLFVAVTVNPDRNSHVA